MLFKTSLDLIVQLLSKSSYQFTTAAKVSFVCTQKISSVKDWRTFFLQEVKLLLKIFHCTDRTFDSSVRAGAAEILLENKPTTAVVRNLLLATMEDTKSYELSTYLSKKIVDMAKYNPTLR